MSALVIPLTSVRRDDVGRVGGKAAMLGSLHAAGFPVPAGLCLTTAAFVAALEPYHPQLTTSLRDDVRQPAVAQATARAMAETLVNLAVPDAVVTALWDALPAVAGPDVFLAVRSSATAEDRADTSFAGQYETVLGVRGEAALHEAIVTCWLSFFTAHALAARADAGVLHDDAMAVLIQPVVDAECSGICFSVDPVRQRRETIVVEAAWGWG